MKRVTVFLVFIFIAVQLSAQAATDTTGEMKSLERATGAVRDAFAKGDAALVASLHAPNVIKYFGGNNVVTGRAALESGLREMFKNNRVEFTEVTVESTVFNVSTAVQVVIYVMKATPKSGGTPNFTRGRSMLVFTRDNRSPTGWLTLREMTQEAPR